MSMSKHYAAVVYGDKARFHVEFGPPALFERVQFKMKNVHIRKPLDRTISDASSRVSAADISSVKQRTADIFK